MKGKKSKFQKTLREDLDPNLNKDKVKKPLIPIDAVAFCIILGALLLMLIIFLAIKIHRSQKDLLPLGTLFVVAGVVFEFKNICKEWKYVLFNSIAAFILSFLAFLPGKHEKPYLLENHITSWPYFFCAFFILFAITIYKDKIIQKLSEGITLLQSIAIIYWLIDTEGFSQTNQFLRLLSFLSLAYAIFSIFLAFSYIELSRRMRFSLSFWSSIIMAVFAVENIYTTFHNPAIEFSKRFYEGLFISTQFFLLGVSAIYIAQNISMILGFLPGKDTLFNKEYFHDIRELRKDHINRYSTEQIKKSHALWCILSCTLIFYLNLKFQLFPRQFIIWSAFVIFPFFIHLLFKKKKY